VLPGRLAAGGTAACAPGRWPGTCSRADEAEGGGNQPVCGLKARH
jgi:hypothetical protein